MKDDLNRILLALIAQVSNATTVTPDRNGGGGAGDRFSPARDSGENAREAALRSFLFDSHSSDTGVRFSVADVLSGAMDDVARAIPDGITTTVERRDGSAAGAAASDDTSLATGERVALERLTTLLAAQAVHAIVPGPGRIFARIERVDEAEVRQECPELGPGDHVRFVVEAFSGAAAGGASALDPLFHVARPGGDSWNLGLALARKAAWSLGGVVCQASDRSLCTAYLPLAGQLQPRSRPSLAGSACSSRLGLGILYVSGEEAILAMGRPSLIESDCCVSVASNGRDALHHLGTRPDDVDVVVIEDDLEDVGAEALASALRERVDGLPVLLARRAALPAEREVILQPFSAGDLRTAAWRATAPPRIGLA